MGVSVQDVMSLILDHASVMGWDACCWSDGALSSKQIYPQRQFAAKSKKWLPRVKTSDASMRMLAQRVQATHEKAARFCQKKLALAFPLARAPGHGDSGVHISV